MRELIPTPFALTVIIAIALVASIIHVYRLSRKDGSAMTKMAVGLPMAVAVLSACAIVSCIGLYIMGSNRGMTTRHWMTMRIDEIAEATRNAPVSETIPDDAEGHVAILYKYGCTDCEKVRDDLKRAISDTGIENVHWVATTSEDGRRLVEETEIQDVPAIVYMRRKPLANGATTTHMSVCTKLDDGEIAVDTGALKRIKLLQKQQR